LPLFRLREITGFLAQNFGRLLQGQADGLVIKRDLQLRLTGKKGELPRKIQRMYWLFSRASSLPQLIFQQVHLSEHLV
jgi:hypothetical protein